MTQESDLRPKEIVNPQEVNEGLFKPELGKAPRYNPKPVLDEILSSKIVWVSTVVGAAAALIPTEAAIGQGIFNADSQIYLLTMAVGALVGFGIGALWWKVSHRS